ncbi:MAG: hypothetical protein R2873_23760 [Caldilineaceae bacterium]
MITWLEENAHRDADTLFHAAAQLVRVGIDHITTQIHGDKHLTNPRVEAASVARSRVRIDSIPQLFPNLQHGVE